MRLPASITLALATLAVAHPGEDHRDELEQRRSFEAKAERLSLRHCAETLKARGVTERNIKRRSALIEEYRKKRGIKKRDLEDVLNTDHNKTDLGYTPNTPAETLFAGQNSGESVRRNLKEDQEGVDLILDYQIINVDTCEPVPDLYLEIWHCNSTGVYGGVVNQGNGNIDDKANIDKTFGRGIQPTDEDGVAQFETIFPGHYTGRTAHIHLLAHANATLYENKTLGNNIYSSHIGQTYFDQDLIHEVESLAPYNTNKQELTTNAGDGILAGAANQDYDPVVEWTLLGDTVADGLFGWLAYGINITVTDKVNPAVFRYEDGGHANPSIGGGRTGGSQRK
ncbi:hypothetical protein F53441_12418 [Fusarium austroafricanum]|uniref:Intradiol ring-cleavage dioxygenases domain-containing protein n=1 Tax=Fusarium austroafricanum TaxID=2364996 RepID=A0A8H4JZM1_9HYPO|nr:hypothetical protein F53441_12418 [Fusarium austroafricanum]